MNELKTYSELVCFHSYKERFEYLKLDGTVGSDTFGFDRFMNQAFYKSKEWQEIRDYVIIRDNGCDLGIDGYEIFDKNSIRVHHMNPITPKDIQFNTDILLNPDYLITTTHQTHNAIHYGDEALLITEPIQRNKNDTCPWRK